MNNYWHRRKKGCKNKRVYYSRAAAKFFASIFKQSVYKCPDCKMYHLTSQEQKK